jgi:ketosteroid isomerase-like protein
VSTSNLELVERFYAAFAARDGEAMAACYAPDATFTDPVFQDLSGSEPGAMWRMLTGRATDLQVELVEHETEGESGTARWVAHYTFTQTGRPVVNDVRSRFRFRNGLIAEQQDEFAFYRWARQALGPIGQLLGWTPMIRSAVRRQARRGLEKFMAGSA